MIIIYITFHSLSTLHHIHIYIYIYIYKSHRRSVSDERGEIGLQEMGGVGEQKQVLVESVYFADGVDLSGE